MTIQWWKLGRELDRLRQQLRAIPESLTDPIRLRHHDAHRDTLLHQTAGHQEVGHKIAVFLLFQPEGLAESTFWTCEHLVRKGYAPLVISNAPLNEGDAKRLRLHAWRVVERPNFGYDFGGYRDAIWLIQQAGIVPEHLLILNDSIWYPLQADETLLDRMESSTASFVGALQLDPTRDSEDRRSRKRPFYGSFFMMIKRSAFVHQAFANFWLQYKVTSNKYKTIRRGERGLSHAMLDAGIKSEAIYQRQALDRHIADMTSAELRNALTTLVTPEAGLEKSIEQCAASDSLDANWRALAVALALKVTTKQNILASAPVISLKEFGVPYLKKAKDPGNMRALSILAAQWDRSALPEPHPAIRAEIRERLTAPIPRSHSIQRD